MGHPFIKKGAPLSRTPLPSSDQPRQHGYNRSQPNMRYTFSGSRDSASISLPRVMSKSKSPIPAEATGAIGTPSACPLARQGFRQRSRAKGRTLIQTLMRQGRRLRRHSSSGGDSPAPSRVWLRFWAQVRGHRVAQRTVPKKRPAASAFRPDGAAGGVGPGR